jgi:hypothetical protein
MGVPDGVSGRNRNGDLPIPVPGCGRGLNGRRKLVAEAGADGYTLAANGAAAAEDGCAGLCFHTRTETMGLYTFTAIGLKCALGHGDALLFPKENLCLTGKLLVYRRLGQESSGGLAKGKLSSGKSRQITTAMRTAER